MKIQVSEFLYLFSTFSNKKCVKLSPNKLQVQFSEKLQMTGGACPLFCKAELPKVPDPFSTKLNFLGCLTPFLQS